MSRALRPAVADLLPVTVFALWLLAGVLIFLAPRQFHELTPGVALFGPFNSHFIRDVALAYFASGLVGLYGVRAGNALLCIAAALWSCLHALFHLHVWIDRGLPLDGIFLFDLAFVIVPPFVVIAALGIGQAGSGVRR